MALVLKLTSVVAACSSDVELSVSGPDRLMDYQTVLGKPSTSQENKDVRLPWAVALPRMRMVERDQGPRVRIVVGAE